MPVHQQSEKIILTHSTGASAEVYFYGSTLTSWKVAGKERIFLRLEMHSQENTRVRALHAHAGALSNMAYVIFFLTIMTAVTRRSWMDPRLSVEGMIKMDLAV